MLYNIAVDTLTDPNAIIRLTITLSEEREYNEYI